MKIAFLFKRDSHFKAVKSTALRVCAQYNCEATFIGIDAEILPTGELYPIFHISKEDLTSLYEYDYVIACLGGYLLNQVASVLRSTDTKIISIFPGIVSHYQLDAFISRLNVDEVWLNSKADFELYRRICKVLGCFNNGILYGMSWIQKDDSDVMVLDEEKDGSSVAVFFEQTEIFPEIKNKHKLKNTLIHVIRCNSQVLFRYKVRNNTSDKFFIDLRKDLSSFKNVEVISSLSKEDQKSINYYLSVSSSALVEGLLNDKRAYIIDKELMDSDSQEFYKNSGLELSCFTLKSTESNMDISWFDYRVQKPLTYIDLKMINKNLNHTPSHGRNINSIRLLVVNIGIKHRISLTQLLKIKRLKSFQKAFEYLG